jgi:hypothetical protein
MTAWINRLTRTELTRYLDEQSISSEGTVDDLRRRLRDFFRNNPTALTPINTEGERTTVGSHELDPPKTEVLLTLPAGPLRPETPRCDDDRGSYFSAADPPTPAIKLADPARIMNQIQKWSCHFEGKNPVTFLERIEELQGTGTSAHRCCSDCPNF